MSTAFETDYVNLIKRLKTGAYDSDKAKLALSKFYPNAPPILIFGFKDISTNLTNFKIGINDKSDLRIHSAVEAEIQIPKIDKKYQHFTTTLSGVLKNFDKILESELFKKSSVPPLPVLSRSLDIVEYFIYYPYLKQNYPNAAITLLIEANVAKVFLGKERAYAIIMPQVYHNIANQIHRDDGPALEAQNSDKLFYFRGRPVDSKFIIGKDTLTTNDILVQNLEERRRIMEMIGAERFARILGVRPIDADTDSSGNRRILYKTRKSDPRIQDGYVYFVNVVCPSTGREYYICVPPCTTVQEGVAWTFKKTGTTYKPIKET